MTNEQLAAILQVELERRGWSIPELARSAGMNYETVRRAVKGIGQTSLENANKLLAIIDRDLIAEPQ